MIRFTKRTVPSSPPASTVRTYYDTAGQGYNTPAALAAIDESGNIAQLGHFAALDYKLLKVTTFTASATWTPTNGCRAYFIELVGGGAQGGGAATSSSTVSVGSGGGGGAYVSGLVAPTASTAQTIIVTVAFTIGAAGSGAAAGATGTVGGDTLWPTSTSYFNAKGGSGGIALAAAATVGDQIGGGGGLAASCVAGSANVPANTTITATAITGGNGCTGFRFSGSAGGGLGGDGGGSFWCPGIGGQGRVAAAGGLAGQAALAGQYGAGGGGAATSSTSAAGGAGIGGAIRVWEFA